MHHKPISELGNSRRTYCLLVSSRYIRGKEDTEFNRRTKALNFCGFLGGDHKTGLASKLYGVNHISIMTMDINKTLDLYVDQLGGHLIDDIQPSHLQSKIRVHYIILYNNIYTYIYIIYTI